LQHLKHTEEEKDEPLEDQPGDVLYINSNFLNIYN